MTCVFFVCFEVKRCSEGVLAWSGQCTFNEYFMMLFNSRTTKSIFPFLLIERRTLMAEQMVLYCCEESVYLERIRLGISPNTLTHGSCSIEPLRLILSVNPLGWRVRLPRLCGDDVVFGCRLNLLTSLLEHRSELMFVFLFRPKFVQRKSINWNEYTLWNYCYNIFYS